MALGIFSSDPVPASFPSLCCSPPRWKESMAILYSFTHRIARFFTVCLLCGERDARRQAVVHTGVPCRGHWWRHLGLLSWLCISLEDRAPLCKLHRGALSASEGPWLGALETHGRKLAPSHPLQVQALVAFMVQLDFYCLVWPTNCFWCTYLDLLKVGRSLFWESYSCMGGIAHLELNKHANSPLINI